MQEIPGCKEYNDELIFEAVGAIYKKGKIAIITVYRSPNGNFQSFIMKLESLLGQATSRYPTYDLYIAGDFNINQMGDSEEKTLLLNSLLQFGLHPLFHTPSRVTNSSATCIDNIFTNAVEHVASKEVVNPHLSDHLAQTIMVNIDFCDVKEKKKLQLRNKSSDNRLSFERMIRTVDWHSLVSENGCASYSELHCRFFSNLRRRISYS